MLSIWTSPLSSTVLMICVLLLLGGGLHDLIARSIPNAIPAAVTLLGVATRLLNGEVVGAVVAGFLVFVSAVFCWRRGWLGGGDVKLLAAAALALPPVSVLPFIAAVAIAGGVLALMYLAARPLTSSHPATRPAGLFARALRVERWRIGRGGPLPYACAIAAGFVFAIL
jgi:prepilin peptidase CpaA